MKIDLQKLMRSKTPFQRLLNLFLRGLFIYLFYSGILNWLYLVEIVPVNGEIFTELSLNWRSMVIFLAIVDISAAVGVWLQATWGIVIWIFRTFSLIIWSIAIDSSFDLSGLTMSIFVIAIALYIILKYSANVEMRTTVQRGLGLT